MTGHGAIVGIDVGATLCKLARVAGEDVTTRHLPATDVAAIHGQVVAWRPQRVVATGGGADRLGPTIAGCAVGQVGEFAAWGRGAAIVAEREGVVLPARHLTVSLGTGTSVLAVADGQAERVGGTALGGGTLLGLGRLLTDRTAHDELCALAAQGDRRRVDLLIGDLYRTAPLPVLRDLSASSFAKLASREPADLAHAVVGLVGENVALIAGALARATGTQTIVYCGSTLLANAPLRAILEEITTVFGNQPVFLAGGAYCGAIGAAALAE